MTFLQNHTVPSKSRRREKLAQTMLKLAELKNKMRSMSVSENFERQAYGSGNRLFKLARSRVTGREREYVPSVEDRLEDLAINEASGMKKMLKLERIVNAELKKINALREVSQFKLPLLSVTKLRIRRGEGGSKQKTIGLRGGPTRTNLCRF